jgi:hypothetical protein
LDGPGLTEGICLEFIEKSSDRLIYRLHAGGKWQLMSLLECFPLPSQWEVELSRSDTDGELEEDRQFLEETLEAEKLSLEGGIRRFLDSPTIFTEDEGGEDLLRLPVDQVDWFLLVLNDLRVGAWQLLGCPDADEKSSLEALIHEEVPPDKVREIQLFIMLELAGYFQSVVLSSVMDAT